MPVNKKVKKKRGVKKVKKKKTKRKKCPCGCGCAHCPCNCQDCPCNRRLVQTFSFGGRLLPYYEIQGPFPTYDARWLSNF